ncbi:hypothetical protein ANCCAN_17104 [Ancylostoma caninum]|uniref:Uncharacterized protein n=1 Tax=Ancylostoma caninum TaxID=29170 RepID=A0A368G1W9_ANCCA|nr:hypothetical protein ANCCAN_17104 [Ancylostoma caninum]
MMKIFIILLAFYGMEAASKCPNRSHITEDHFLKSLFVARVTVLSKQKAWWWNSYIHYQVKYEHFYNPQLPIDVIVRRVFPTKIGVPKKCRPVLEKGVKYVIGCLNGDSCLFVRRFDELTAEEKALITRFN